MTNSALRNAAGPMVSVALGTIIGGAAITGGPRLAQALFARPAVFETARWTACEYAVESCSDSVLEFRLQLRGRAGWKVVSARRAVGQDGDGRYEFVLCRPMADQKADDILKANRELKSLELETAIARLKAMKKFNGQ